jgi:hypothetical protein
MRNIVIVAAIVKNNVLWIFKSNIMNKKSYQIAVDFDGTCVTNSFPQVGEDIGAVRVLKRLVEAGHKLILYTMRADRDQPNPTGDDTIMDVTGQFLTDALNWFKENDIPLYGIQTNPTQKNWTKSPKCYAELYIDDAALGAPLKHNPDFHPRPYIDWNKAETLLVQQGIL